MYQIKNFDLDIFLSEYWQKKPLLIKQGFTHFADPLDENELAGLALESSIDSRVISHRNKKWQVNHGPFDDINKHCKGAWSLLVQAVDQHVPEADELMRAFSFIPHWRMTDLMVSFSNKDAGVGPHIDQYDVFIVQGKGSRRWQVGLPGDYENKIPHPDLKQISDFTPFIDEILEPGDIIYIPPHHPHNGVAQQNCMNYSVGFRAPSQQELLASFSDYALEHNLFKQRYVDKNIATREHAGEIKQQEVSAFKQLIQQTLDTAHFDEWLLAYLSESQTATEQQDEPTEPYTEQEIVEWLSEGRIFVRESGIKPIFKQQDATKDFVFYIQNQRFSCPSTTRSMALHLLNEAEFCVADNADMADYQCLVPLLTALVNAGFWFPE